ncbi:MULTISPECIES: hypothetical protein [unclassified Oceanispirochaeta]|uniref:hypothetical protein n=1 Tax=unclassified Oceanispirochaeta TaxID=2635722 RepID=UPI000E099766|nr:MULTISPECIES: hypothetical protein [unclassified Oceanispirochaeta]MBF9018802.1 hypothetical protein [Oceanispirochaeta sp. M2]NPD75271.1 hypothetical protein [Oceanispirochaeta sp. M1]RDG28885.1 hypothetical protein DV872_24560 [Oceanispirochaeta sp. M1]
MKSLSEKAGGEAPRPVVPDVRDLEEIRLTPAGNEQLLAIFNIIEDFEIKIEQWEARSEAIEKRWNDWQILEKLKFKAQGIPDSEVLDVQVETLKEKRQLIDEPNPMNPLIKGYTDLLRSELNGIQSQWKQTWEDGESQLHGDDNFNSLDPEDKHKIRRNLSLLEGEQPQINLEDTSRILASLGETSIESLKDKLAALPNRYKQAQMQAAKELEPKAREVILPSRTMKTEQDIDAWMEEVKAELLKALEDGPVVIG